MACASIYTDRRRSPPLSTILESRRLISAGGGVVMLKNNWYPGKRCGYDADNA